MTKSDPRLIVALDKPTIQDAWALIEALGDTVSFYKIGLQLIPVGGMELNTRLKQAGKQVFLDYKLREDGPLEPWYCPVQGGGPT